MHLWIDGRAYDFIPLKTFRAEYHLPDSFGVALFEPKDYTDLGSIEHAGEALNQVHDKILARIPDHLSLMDLLACKDDLQNYFHQCLLEINDQVRLHPPEIEFAVAGFGDVLQGLVYALIRHHSTYPDLPPTPDLFTQAYHEWLMDSVRVSQTLHPYPYPDDAWSVQVVTHAYGRVGLIIHTPHTFHYVYDSRLACPAEGYMHNLLSDMATALLKALTSIG
jgi:hypothetical protein